jgi:glycosyltransferase involved in cell wall biosynthesis
MSGEPRAPVVYVLKRYPRLTETFILNEIRAMERLGARLRIFSLLPPEPPPHHPAVAEVRARVFSPAESRFVRARTVARAHWATLRAAPLRYARTLALTLRRTLTSHHPLSLWRQFVRAGVLADVCRREGARHIHAHFANAPTSVAHFAHRMTGIPFSFTAHAKDIYLARPQILRRHLLAAEFVTTCTGYNAEYLRRLVPESDAGRIRKVYHGIDLDTFAPSEPGAARSLPKPRALILAVGRLVPKKGHEDLLAACATLRDRGLGFDCEIVGSGPLRSQLLDAVGRLGLGDQVTLRGSMTHRELIERYRAADLFVLAPRIAENGDRDGIPNVIAEAMAIGVPVVATDVSGIPELVRDGRTGLLAPSRNPLVLAAAMERLLVDRELARRLAGEARRVLAREFDLWQTTRELHELIADKEHRLAWTDASASRAAA